MKALLLAGGMGTRLRPITDTIPKCLVPIGGKPLLSYWLDLLLANGIERVLVNTHYLPDQVNRFLDQSPWADRIDRVQESELLGTGGTVRRNLGYFGGTSFMVAHADNLVRFDVAAFLARHEQRPDGVDITMMTFETDTPRSCGVVELDARGIVTAFHEKVANPPSNLANGAIYLFAPAVGRYLAALDADIIDLSTEVIPHFIGRIQTYHNDDYLRDIGTPEALQRAERDYFTS